MKTISDKAIIRFIRDWFKSEDFIPLHAPVFAGKEKKYLLECIDSTFVSSVGPFVDKFEKELAAYTGSKMAIATSNGTAALHICLLLAGVEPGDLVITQAATFIATGNAISYCGATPVFVDIDEATLGLSPEALESWLVSNAIIRNGVAVEKATGRKITAVLPMHTFGYPCHIEAIAQLCQDWHIALVEDAAESIGATVNAVHTGNFGLCASMSFNGNKTITCGGGGAIITNDEALGKRAKHLTTQAKKPHKWDFEHDATGYNYRMPNINAALACAQLEVLDQILEDKKLLHTAYAEFFEGSSYKLLGEPEGHVSNHWLNVLLVRDAEERDQLLQATNDQGIMTRPLWRLLYKLPMFAHAVKAECPVSERIESTLVNLPSSCRAAKISVI